MTKATSDAHDQGTGTTPFRNLLTLGDAVRYVAWTLLGRRGTFRCRLRTGPTLSIRPEPSGDWDTAYEVFRLRTYHTGLAPETVRRIVDVGGNVGYSCLFWCSVYPKAGVLTYEPHPLHCELLNWHMRTNHYADRVTLIPAGAAARASIATLVDDGIRSRLVQGEGSANAPVIGIKTVDFFETVGSESIDILKIDIEGGEYELFQDPRFDEVAGRSRCIVMEWHKRAPDHLGGRWCKERLEGLGFTIADTAEPSPTQDIGTLLAFRN